MMKRIVEHTDTTVAPRAKEYLLYGSGRLGIAYADNAHGGAPVSGALYRRVVGKKQYELSDHLGNVRATVGDVKVRSGSTFAARVESFTEYFAFGMEAKSGGSGGRFGFNGYEKADEVAEGKYSADYREYDSRVARWTALDPRLAKYPDHSPYSAYGGNPILFADIKGDSLTPKLKAVLDKIKETGVARLNSAQESLARMEKDKSTASGLLKEVQDKVSSLKTELAKFDKEMKKLEESSVIYDLIYVEQTGNKRLGADLDQSVRGQMSGGIIFMEGLNRVTIAVKKEFNELETPNILALIVHETVHLYQYQSGQLGFVVLSGGKFPLLGSDPETYDATDELHAYQRMVLLIDTHLSIKTVADVKKKSLYKDLPEGPLDVEPYMLEPTQSNIEFFLKNGYFQYRTILGNPIEGRQ